MRHVGSDVPSLLPLELLNQKLNQAVTVVLRAHHIMLLALTCVLVCLADARRATMPCSCLEFLCQLILIAVDHVVIRSRKEEALLTMLGHSDSIRLNLLTAHLFLQ